MITKKENLLKTEKYSQRFLPLHIILVIILITLSGCAPIREISIPEVAIEDEREITLLAVGDVNLGRKAGKIILGGKIDYAFEKTRHIISGADIAFANLESTISDQGGVTKTGTWRFTAPPDAAKSLKNAGFDIVSMANNHVWDYGKDALFETIEHLNGVKIKSVGVGEDLDSAYAPVIMEVNGIKVAFIAVADIFNYGVYPDHKAFKYLAWLNKDTLKERIGPKIKEAKELADVVVVSAHWGWEYKDKPSDLMVEYAHEIADLGADIILGHHPHVPQGLEVYNDTFIIYSLGNFAFHQSRKHSKWKKLSIILILNVTKDGVKSFEMIPVKVGFQPEVAEGELADEIISHVWDISFSVDLFDREDDATGLPHGDEVDNAVKSP